MFHVEHKKKEMKKVICSAKDYLVSGKTFSIVWDSSTQYAHTYPRPKANQMDSYYASKDYISHNDSNKSFLSTAYRVARNLMFVVKFKMFKDLIPPHGKVLDYGCGTGDFLKYLTNKKIKGQGVETNAHARDQCEQKSLEVFSSWGKLSNAKYDMITFWHVLEHVSDLDECFQSICNYLKKKGTLLIAVPNLNSFDAKFYKEYWAAYDVPRHLWHFSEEGIKRLVEPFGFELTRKHPLLLDALYIACISEKHKGSRLPILRGLFRGLQSNIRAYSSGEYSSLVYVFKNTN